MQDISKTLKEAMDKRVKSGEWTEPYCRVEVDRLTFIEGSIESLEYTVPVLTMEEIEYFGTGSSEVRTTSITFPVQGSGSDKINSNYGLRNSKPHKGVDISRPKGANILAAWDGVVIRADETDSKGYGKQIIIEHPNGYMTQYGHLKSFAVNVGEMVTQGQVIGLMGNTGRSSGDHLHFEIRVPNDMAHRYPDPKYPANWKAGYTVINPRIYLDNADKKITTGVTTSNGKVTQNNYVKGKEPLYSDFFDAEWKNNIGDGPGGKRHWLSDNFKHLYIHMPKTKNYKPDGGYAGIFIPGGYAGASAYFDLYINFVVDTVIDLSYYSNFSEKNGEYLTIYAGSNLNNLREVRKMIVATGNNYHDLNGIPISKSDKVIRFEITWDQYSKDRAFYFDKLQIYSYTQVEEDSIYFNGPDTAGGNTNNELHSTNVNDPLAIEKRKVDIPVGRFVYRDTMEVPNIMSVELDYQYDLESSIATVTLTNTKSTLDPEYDPWSFPEIAKQTDFSYYDGGGIIGVLGENTPIRIYLGYGKDDIRMFTGLIDRTDVDGNNGTLTIHCRDMYKKILNKVLTEDKIYGSISDLGIATEPVLDSEVDDTQVVSLTRTDKIIYYSQYYASIYSVDYKFILAIALHETALGTLGAGRESSGSYICGYGVYSASNKDSKYAGIESQCKYVALRIKEALNGRKIDSLDTVKYFWKGGDKGNYQYASDTKWPDKVWNAYQTVKNDTTYNKILFNDTGSISDGIDAKERTISGSWWVKSSIVHDLVNYAGIAGWRANHEDLLYPDVVIEETYLIEADPLRAKIIKAIPNEQGKFEEVDAETIPTLFGWLNPFVERPKHYKALQTTVHECIQDLLQDINYRSYCDRYGTYRFEKLRFVDRPVTTVSDDEGTNNFTVIRKTLDFSRARSLVIVQDSNGNGAEFVDPDILRELKGEVRIATVHVPWAESYSEKESVAERLFWDMKRICRTIQIQVPGTLLHLDPLDNVYISSKSTSTRAVYVVKGIKTNYSQGDGITQTIDLFWNYQI